MRPLIPSDDPRLKEKCQEVPLADIGKGVFAPLIDEMHQRLILDRGIGIAAPQLGETIRLIAFEDTHERMVHLSNERKGELNRYAHPFFVLFNPFIEPASDEVTYYFEGCLSFPGQMAVVKRWRDIRFEGYESNLRLVRWTSSGWLARCMQHEADHLDGISFLDRALKNSIMPFEEFLENWKDKTSDELKMSFA